MSAEPQPNVDHGDREVALANEILRVTVGSGTHGMAMEGHDDNDEMGVYVQDATQLLGLAATEEHYVSRTQPEGARSGPGDTDLVIYALRKFIRLAAAGNPTILIPFWSPDSDLLLITPLGSQLRDLGRTQFATRHAGHRFLGYLDGQRDRLTGRGRQSQVPNRPELVAAHGYDTKYASHALASACRESSWSPPVSSACPCAPKTSSHAWRSNAARSSTPRPCAASTRPAHVWPSYWTGPSPYATSRIWMFVDAWLVDAHRRPWGWVAHD